MVRISDILKKRMQGGFREEQPQDKQEPAKEESPQELQEAPPTSGRPLEETMVHEEPEEAKEPEKMQIAKTMKELALDEKRSKEIYDKAVQSTRGQLKNVSENRPIELDSIKDLLAEIINYLILGDKILPMLFYEDYPPQDYLSYRSVNLMIMSVNLGLRLGYNKSSLNELGMAAFLYDTGMIGVKGVASQPGVPDEEKYKKNKQHTAKGENLLSATDYNLPEAVIDTIRYLHEQMKSKASPEGHKDGPIAEYASIIGTIDIYETLTHARPDRKRIPPHEAIKEMIHSRSPLLDKDIFRTMIGMVGIYPTGSYVLLNTDEVAKVVMSNDAMPIRPVVSIIFEANKNRVKEPRLVNLAKEFNIFIKKPLADEDVLQLTQS